MNAIEKVSNYSEKLFHVILSDYWKAISFFGIVGLIISYYFNLTMNKDVWFWFFSSVAQTFAALVALVAIFYIFRLEYYRSRIKTNFDSMRERMQRSLGTEVDKMTTDALKKEAKRFCDSAFGARFSELLNEIKYLEQKKEQANKLMTEALILVSIIISASIFLIPLGSVITEDSQQLNFLLKYPNVKWVFVYGIVGLCMASLYKIIFALGQFLSENE